MKRHPALRPLSDDHHRSLVLARRLRRSGGQTAPAEVASLCEAVRREFEAQIEPHFRIEERWLLPALERAGSDALVRRTRDDHARLRQRVRDPWSGETAAELGALLEEHVRFEERVLYPEAEARLSEPELARVQAAASPGERGR